MAWSHPIPEKVNKISVLRKMIGLDKKIAPKQYVVPQNSALNLEQKSEYNQTGGAMTENSYDRNNVNKCPHCENMAKNFLYLESLIRNNYDRKQNCSLCSSSMKYLQYVNRNIMQVFGNFDSIVQAAKAFATQAPLPHKYTVKPVMTRPVEKRVKGGAVIPVQKSSKSLKTAPVKKQKSTKSLNPSKSGKSLSKRKSKATGVKSGAGSSKLVMKPKHKSKTGKLFKLVRSASQYHSLRAARSKLTNKAKKQKKLAKNQKPSIPWGLLKKNMPKRKVPTAN